jgi:ribosomal protein L11 methyltransferase
MNWVQMTFPQTVKPKNFIYINAIIIEKGAVDVIIKNYSKDSLSPQHQMIALFDNKSTALQVKNTLCDFFKILNIKIGELENKSWKKQAIDKFSLINITNKLYIHPKWKQPPNNNNMQNMVINTGISFGSGKHSATKLCLGWIAKSSKIKDCNALDYGCGTGILAISSLLFGAKSVIATDIEPDALKETKKNAKDNNITGKQLQVYTVDKIPDNPVDILFANLYGASSLITLEPTLRQLIKIGGLILLSGFQSNESKYVEKAYLCNFDLKNRLVQNDWILLVAQRKF